MPEPCSGAHDEGHHWFQVSKSNMSGRQAMPGSSQLLKVNRCGLPGWSPGSGIKKARHSGVPLETRAKDDRRSFAPLTPRTNYRPWGPNRAELRMTTEVNGLPSSFLTSSRTGHQMIHWAGAAMGLAGGVRTNPIRTMANPWWGSSACRSWFSGPEKMWVSDPAMVATR